MQRTTCTMHPLTKKGLLVFLSILIAVGATAIFWSLILCLSLFNQLPHWLVCANMVVLAAASLTIAFEKVLGNLAFLQIDLGVLFDDATTMSILCLGTVYVIIFKTTEQELNRA